VSKGATKVISDHKAAWLMEITGNPDDQSRAKGVVTFLEQYNYRPNVFNGTKMRERRYGDNSVNYFSLQAGAGRE